MKDHCATVCEVEIFPHGNADRLELARPIGTDWQVVVGKGQFKTGDLAVYIPIDSLIDQAFFDKHLAGSKIDLDVDAYGLRRIKSVKIRKALSQGLLVNIDPGMQLEQDVTELLNVKKYEPPEPKWYKEQGPKLPKKQSKFRRFVTDRFPKYTHIENYKSNKNLIDDETVVVLTEKIHGTNFRAGRVYIGDFEHPWYKKVWYKLFPKAKQEWLFTVGSHNAVKWYEDEVYWGAAKKYGLDKLGPEWNGYIFYGEVYGGNIQELNYGVMPGETKLAIFDIMYYNQYGQFSYLNWDMVCDICERLHLETVPVLFGGPWKSVKDNMEKYCDGNSTIEGARHHREGFVVKPYIEQWKPGAGRVIQKRVSDVYLLSKGKKTDFH